MHRLVAQRAIAQHTDEGAAIESFGNPQHRVDMAQRNDIRLCLGIDGGQDGIDLAGVILVHCHRYEESRLATADAADDFEATHVRAHQEGALAKLRLGAHEGVAFDGDLERIELFVDEIHAIMNGGREIQDVPEAFARPRRTAQRTAQIAARLAPRCRSEQEKIYGDAVERNAA